VRPEMIVEVSYVEMTSDGLLRHVACMGERENCPTVLLGRSQADRSSLSQPVPLFFILSVLRSPRCGQYKAVTKGWGELKWLKAQ